MYITSLRGQYCETLSITKKRRKHHTSLSGLTRRDLFSHEQYAGLSNLINGRIDTGRNIMLGHPHSRPATPKAPLPPSREMDGEPTDPGDPDHHEDGPRL